MTAISLALLALSFTDRIGWCFNPPSPMDTARQLKNIEGLAAEGSEASLSRLASICRSEAEALPKRIKACRLFSKRGSLQSWTKAATPLDASDPLGPVLQLIELRTSLREKKASESEVQVAERRHWEIAATGSDRPKHLRVTQRDYLLSEIIADYEDKAIPVEKLPSVYKEHPAAIALKVKDGARTIKLSAKRIEWLEEALYSKNVYEREAAAALLAAEGESILPRIAKIIDKTLPRKEPPPFTDTASTFSNCLEILAAIGGKEAASYLERLAKSEIPYVARTSVYYLKWINEGVKYPISDARLLSESTADH